MDFLLLPLQYSFLQRAFIEVIFLAVLTGIIGAFIVLKNNSFIGEALAHGVFPGLALGILLNTDIFIAGAVAAVIAAIFITTIAKNNKVSENTTTAIYFSISLGLGIALISSTKNFSSSLLNVFTGNLLGLNNSDLLLTAIVLIATLIFLLATRKKFILSLFDKEFAESININTYILDLIFNILTALTVVVAIQAIGSVLITALLVIPAATAMNFSKNVGTLLKNTILISLLSGIVGLYISYYLGLAAGATIVIVCGVIFIISTFIKVKR